MYRGYVLQTSFSNILNVSVARKNWPSICFKTCGRAIETLRRAFEGLRENQMLSREFGKLGRVFEKLGRVFALLHRPCCPNQPRYQTQLVSSNVTIKNGKEEKVLGINFNNKLDFSTHLTSITKKANIKLNALTRVQKYITPEQKTFLTSFL